MTTILATYAALLSLAFYVAVRRYEKQLANARLIITVQGEEIKRQAFVIADHIEFRHSKEEVWPEIIDGK